MTVRIANLLEYLNDRERSLQAKSTTTTWIDMKLNRPGKILSKIYEAIRKEKAAGAVTWKYYYINNLKASIRTAALV